MSALLDPSKSIDVSQHVNADPGLRKNMLDDGLIYWLMGKWYLTSKGEMTLRLRAAHRTKALNMGIIEPAEHDEAGGAKEEDAELIERLLKEHDND